MSVFLDALVRCFYCRTLGKEMRFLMKLAICDECCDLISRAGRYWVHVDQPERAHVPRPEEPCPDCGNDSRDPDLHADGCRRIFEVGDSREDLQYGPPWRPWRDE